MKSSENTRWVTKSKTKAKKELFFLKKCSKIRGEHMSVIARVREKLPSMISLENERLFLHTTLAIGGPCRALFYPRTVTEMQELVRIFGESDAPFTVLGNGSNVLVTDKGTKAFVIKTQKMGTITVNGNEITADCGVPLPFLSSVAMNKGLSGLEFACGIPGTVGGAVVCNAGAFGKETADVVKNVTLLGENGKIQTLTKEDCAFSYRKSGMTDSVLTATFVLKQKAKSEISRTIKAYTERRTATQPKGKSAGSVFLASGGTSAARLIDEAGLKGLSLGGAKVSNKHANFIMNVGGATATDYKRLMTAVQNAVYGRTGVLLTPEIRIIGEGE